MSSPMSDYSSDARDFLDYYKKSTIQADPRLEFHQDVVKDFGEDYERSYQLWNTYQAQAYKCQSFFLGNQWSLEEMSYLNNQRRSSFTYNKVQRCINMVDGYQRKNRLSTVIDPVENSSEETAELLSDTIQHVMYASKGYEAISRAFRSSLITGISFVSPYLDYRDDQISGDIRYHVDEWNQVTLDPFFTSRSLDDCSFVARRKYLSRSEVCSLIPEKTDVIQSLPWGTRDDKFTYMPYARQWGMQKLMNYNEYWRTRWENKEVLVDMITGETREWNGDKDRLRLFRQIYPYIEVVKKPVRCVELGVIVEGELLAYEKNMFGLTSYPFVPFMVTWEPSYDLYEWKLQGLVAPIMDSQSELNKRRSKMVDILDNQLNSGWIAKTNSVSNPTSLYKSGQGQVIFMKPESQITDIQRIDPAQIPISMFQLEEQFEKDMMEILGLNPEIFGMAEDSKVETAAMLAKMRQSAAIVNLQYVFDGLRDSQQLLGQKTLELIQKNYTPEKIKLITKREPTEEFYSKTFSKYDVVVQEGVLTDTQKQQEFLQRTALRTMGVNITDEELIDSSNLHGKKKITDRINAQNEAMAHQQQMQVQMAMENQAVLTHAANSKAYADQSLGNERNAKIELDHALNLERMERAEEEKTASALNLVKALKELDGMDLDNLTRKLALLRELEGGIDQEKQEPEKPSIT